ncbi:MAG: TetR/AcrR family transcriptional regulator, partial [Polyangiaceae bacterium]|nr:TetR/AcrR family transcriptional regulator [Polyangiaceae bacterium]
INRILLAAGLSKGSFYYYFDDKADLAVAVLEREALRHVAMLDGVREPDTPAEFWAELDQLIARGTEQLRQSPRAATDALMRLGTAASHHAELREKLTSSVLMQSASKLHALWKRGQAIGALRTDLSVEMLLLLIQEIKIALVKLLLPPDRIPTDEELERFIAVHVDLIRRVAQP